MIPLAKNIKRYISLKTCSIAFLAVVFMTVVTVGTILKMRKDVTIFDDGKQIVVKTMKSTVEDVLKKGGVSVSSDDYVSLPLNSRLPKTNERIITIKRAVPVDVLIDGKETELMTYRETVGEAIKNSTISMSPDDKFDGLKADDKIVRDMKIKIIRVKEEVVNENTLIPYNVETCENTSMEKGRENVIRDGKEGLSEKIFKIIFEDGKEVARNIIKETIISNPIDKIVEVGTLLSYKTARGDDLRYTQVLDMRATAYSAVISKADPENPIFGRTCSGMVARKGVIAVDPKVIPLGTRIYVEVAGNTPDYGYAIAGDTGSAIKGDLIDVCFDDYQSSVNWGVKRVKVYILAD